MTVAMQQVEDEDADWLRTLSRRGTRLEVRAMLTVESDPFLASSILNVLSDHAIEGAVDVRRGEIILDTFSPEDD